MVRQKASIQVLEHSSRWHSVNWVPTKCLPKLRWCNPTISEQINQLNDKYQATEIQLEASKSQLLSVFNAGTRAAKSDICRDQISKKKAKNKKKDATKSN